MHARAAVAEVLEPHVKTDKEGVKERRRKRGKTTLTREENFNLGNVEKGESALPAAALMSPPLLFAWGFLSRRFRAISRQRPSTFFGFRLLQIFGTFSK